MNGASAAFDMEIGEATPEIAQREFQRALGHYLVGTWPLLVEDDKRDWREFIIGRYRDLDYLFIQSEITSPIEQMLLPWLMFVEADWFGCPTDGDGPWWTDPLEGDQIFFGIEPQAHIGRYRADFLMKLRGPGGEKGFVIECDGHASHERTKEQAAHDRKRDREMQALGYIVLRFTGSEIYKDACGCARQVEEIILQHTDIGLPRKFQGGANG